MRRPPYRTLAVVVIFAVLGGLTAFAHLDAETYRAYLGLLEVLAGAQGIKSALEHAAAAFGKQPEPPK